MKAFVAMPFDAKLDWIYNILVEYCKKFGVEARRVDKISSVNNIWDAIINEINNCDFVIADFSPDPIFGKYNITPNDLKNTSNTNVATEAGYARAKNKPVIIITSTHDSLPFDWKIQLACIYPDSKEDRESITAFCTRLENRLKSVTKVKSIIQEDPPKLKEFPYQLREAFLKLPSDTLRELCEVYSDTYYQSKKENFEEVESHCKSVEEVLKKLNINSLRILVGYLKLESKRSREKIIKVIFDWCKTARIKTRGISMIYASKINRKTFLHFSWDNKGCRLRDYSVDSTNPPVVNPSYYLTSDVTPLIEREFEVSSRENRNNIEFWHAKANELNIKHLK